MSDAKHRRGRARALVDAVGPPLLIAVGAFAGANLRYAVGLQLPGPAGTLAANVLGSVALGVLLYRGRFVGRLSQEVRLLAGTGLLSSFTTYSTFVLDAVEAAPALALGYVPRTYVLAFAGVLVGIASRSYVDSDTFERAVQILLVLIGVNLLRNGLGL